MLPTVAREVLHRQRSRQAEARANAGSLWRDGDFIFTTTVGSPMDGANVTHRFHKRLDEAHLPSMSGHHLRHGAASLLLAQGANMRVVMEQLGHSQIALTMNTYAHIAPALMQDAADKLQRALSGS